MPAAWLQGGLVTSLRVAPAVASALLESGRLRLFAHLLSRVTTEDPAHAARAEPCGMLSRKGA
jgi:hypothetical protein